MRRFWLVLAGLGTLACGGSTEPKTTPLIQFEVPTYTYTLAQTGRGIPDAYLLFRPGSGGDYDVQFTPAAGSCAGTTGITVGPMSFPPTGSPRGTVAFPVTFRVCQVNSDNTYAKGVTPIAATIMWQGKPYTATATVTLQ